MTDKFNEGARALGSPLKERGARKKLVEEMTAGGLKVDASRVTRIANGELLPSTAERIWLNGKFGVDLLAWDRECEREASAHESGEHVAADVAKDEAS